MPRYINIDSTPADKEKTSAVCEWITTAPDSNKGLM